MSVYVTDSIKREVLETDAGSLVIETPLVGPQGPPGEIGDHEEKTRADNVHGLDTQLDAIEAAIALKQNAATADAELATAIAAVNTSLAAKQESATAATDAELAAAVAALNTTLAAKQDAGTAATDAEVAAAIAAHAAGDASDEDLAAAVAALTAADTTLTTAVATAQALAAAALPRSGGTMTGLLTLSADPTSALHAAPQQYVLARVDAAVSQLLGGAPAAALDTITELGAQLAADESAAAALTSALAAETTNRTNADAAEVAARSAAITALTGVVAGKLAAAQNLADLASAATARTNLGLGTAATKDTPAAGDAAAAQVVKGSDTRLHRAKQSAKVNNVTCAPGVVTPLVVVPCPPLAPGDDMMFMLSMQIRPLGGCNQVTPSINACDAAGAIPAGGANIAFSVIDQPIVGNQLVYAAQWLYDPRLNYVPANINLGDGSGRYIGLHLTSAGGAAEAFSSILQVISGPISSITIDETSANLLDGKGTP